MSGKNFNAERAATALVEAAFLGDVRAARKFHVTKGSLTNWRRLLDTDPDFRALFLSKKARAETDWADRLGRAIVAAIEFLGDTLAETRNRTPAMVHAVSSALATLIEARLALDLLEARLARHDAPPLKDTRPHGAKP